MRLTKILIVDDEPGVLLGVGDQLEAEGYIVVTASDGAEGLVAARKQKPDLIVLDLMLPKMSGFEVCRQLRSEGNQTPILMLTARGEEADKVLGLEFGADDYMTKPFSLRELVARVKAILRRGEDQKAAAITESLEFGEVALDFRKFEARKGLKGVDLTPREFRIMKLFAEKPREVIGRDEFLAVVWGDDVNVTNRTVDNQISSLRKKLEPDPEHPRHILSIRGVGYKFVLEGES